jgi:F0F1-type ATP synthase epsilon subunit
MKLKVSSLERSILEEEVDSVKVRTASGWLEILDKHATMMVSLLEGDIEYGRKGSFTKLKLKPGYLKVEKDLVEVLTK